MTTRLDKKKKIIIGVVFIISLAILVIAMKQIIFSKIEKSDSNAIVTPNVDKNQIEEKSKLEIYEQEDNNLKKYFSKNEEQLGRDSEILEQDRIENQPQNIDRESQRDYLNKQERLMNTLANMSSRENNYPVNNDNNFEKIIELQDRLRSGLAASTASPSYINNMEVPVNSLNEAKVNENKKPVNNQELNDSKKHFQTVGNHKKILQLIPSETLEQKRILDKNIIPIRVKEDMKLIDIPGGLVIPKNTILYGKVSLGEDRIHIDIESYKKDNMLYVLNFKVYDYDGREGIHVNNHSWIKIPSKVSQDVFDYSIERGTNGGSSILGNTSTGIDLKEARNLAVLSAGKEISKEVFEKRRVFLPKKYQLWINAKATNNISN